MKFTSATVLLSLFSSAAYAVTIADLPTCSVNCFATAIASTSCGLTDTVCQCGSAKAAITASVTPCIMTACTDSADQAKTLTVATELCASVSSSSASGTASGTSTATKSSTGTATSSGAATATSNAASSMKAFEVMGAFGVVAAGMLAL